MFFVIFLALSVGVNGYVLLRVWSLLHMGRGIVFYVLWLLLSVSLVGSGVLLHMTGHRAAELLYRLAAMWLGILWLMFWVTVVHDVAHRWVAIPPRVGAGGILGVTLVLAMVGIVQNRRLAVKDVTVEAGTDQRIVFWSDVHLGSMGRKAFVRLIEKTREQEPDMLLIGGDLVDYAHDWNRERLKELARLEVPKYLVLGNHERYAGVERVEKLLEGTGVRLLRNEGTAVKELWLMGIDDRNRKEEMAAVLGEMAVPEDRFTVLMYHRPNGFEAAQRAGVDLMLSGHTHNGQIMPFNFVVQLVYRRIYGIFEEEGTRMVVSSGAGFWGPALRLGSRREIVVVQLTEKGEAGGDASKK